MRRFLAALAVLSVFSLQAQALAFHVHAMSGDEHDDHDRHGPAIHDHGRHHDGERAPYLTESHESGAIITIAVPPAAMWAAEAQPADQTDALDAPALQCAGAVRAVDVRSHGPPDHQSSGLRGPPASTPE